MMDRSLDGDATVAFLLIFSYRAKGLTHPIELVFVCFHVDVRCGCREAVKRCAASPAEQTDSPQLLSQPWQQNPAPLPTPHALALGQLARFGEPVGPDPWLRKRLEDHTKRTVFPSVFQADRSRCGTVEESTCWCGKRPSAIIRATEALRACAFRSANLQCCCPLRSLKQTEAASQRYGYVLWQLQLALILVGVLKIHSLCETHLSSTNSSGDYTRFF